MGRFTKRCITGLAAASMLAGGAFAQGTNIVDDLEHGGNLNNWDGYWYLYATEGAVIANAGPADIYSDMSFKPTEGVGRQGSWAAELKIGDLPAIFESSFYDSWAEKYPEVAMATMLTQDTLTGMGSGFDRATEVKFWARATEPMTVTFKVETVENASSKADAYDKASKNMWDASGQPQYRISWSAMGPNPPSDVPPGQSWTALGYDVLTGSPTPVTFPRTPVHTYNAYFVDLEIEEGWKEYTVKIANGTIPHPEGTAISSISACEADECPWTAGDLMQAGYWGSAYAFQKSKATRLAWVIKSQKNTNISTGASLFVDDISVTGYTHIPDDLCVDNCNKTPAIPTAEASLFSDFDTEFEDAQGNSSERVNALNGYWYFYDDNPAGGSSEIEGDLTTGYINSNLDEGDVLKLTNNGNGSDGAKIEFTVGDAFRDDRNGASVSGFVGIGTNLYDAEAPTIQYYDAVAAGTKGFYFEYKADGDVKFITVEVEDKTSAEANNGEVYYTRIPIRDGDLDVSGQWKAAFINFSALKQPFWSERTAPLNLSELAKIQFKVQGAKGVYGTLQVDNMYLLEGETSVRHIRSSRNATAGIRATYNRGTIGVNWNAPSQIRDGKLSLVNVKGRTVASSKIRNVSGNKISANLGAGKIPTGMYFVRINARDVNGKRIVQQVPISIVK